MNFDPSTFKRVYVNDSLDWNNLEAQHAYLYWYVTGFIKYITWQMNVGYIHSLMRPSIHCLICQLIHSSIYSLSSNLHFCIIFSWLCFYFFFQITKTVCFKIKDYFWLKFFFQPARIVLSYFPNSRAFISCSCDLYAAHGNSACHLIRLIVLGVLNTTASFNI